MTNCYFKNQTVRAIFFTKTTDYIRYYTEHCTARMICMNISHSRFDSCLSKWFHFMKFRYFKNCSNYVWLLKLGIVHYWSALDSFKLNEYTTHIGMSCVYRGMCVCVYITYQTIRHNDEIKLLCRCQKQFLCLLFSNRTMWCFAFCIFFKKILWTIVLCEMQCMTTDIENNTKNCTIQSYWVMCRPIQKFKYYLHNINIGISIISEWRKQVVFSPNIHTRTKNYAKIKWK